MTSAIKKESWDIILCDYNLPQFNAPEALKLLQKTNLDIPFIVVSGFMSEDVAIDRRSGLMQFILPDSSMILAK